MISGRDIVYISSIEWSFLWQAHQEIARRLAAAGNRVLYIENTGVRSPGLRDAGRVASRLKHWLESLRSQGVRQVAPNIFVCSPLVLPPFGSPWRRRLNRHVFLRVVRNVMRRLQMRDPLFWTYLPTDTALDLIAMNRTSSSLVVYYGVADFSYLTPCPEQLKQSERQLLQLSDVVFANCSELAYRFSQWNSNAHVFAPGVDMSAFPEDFPEELQPGVETPLCFPGQSGASSLSSLSRPIIGYVGGLHRLVDYALIAELARTRPAWSWVFLGAQQVGLDLLKELPNVYLLGQQQHGELVSFIRYFDVCIVPYLNTEEMRTVVPTKINEYLAAGKPVVSTNLPAVCEFNEEHQVLVIASPEPNTFLRSIESALEAPCDTGTMQRRRAVAALADWQVRLERMSRLIEEQIPAEGAPEEVSA